MGCTAFNFKLEAESGHGDSQSIVTLFNGVYYGFVIQSERFLELLMYVYTTIGMVVIQKKHSLYPQ